MSKTCLYRAVNAASHDVIYDYVDGVPVTEVAAPGEVVFGRSSGYLSRSGAVSAGTRSGVAFEIIRSERVTTN